MKSKGFKKPFYEQKDVPDGIRKGTSLWVDEMFYSIQAEGPFAGMPAYFIRLYGCNLNCEFCDTPQDKVTPKKMKIKKIVDKVKKENPGYCVVITGGEPFMYRLKPLVDKLREHDFWIQFETAGTIEPSINLKQDGIRVVVSPKTKKIHKSYVETAMVFKYVVSNDNRDPKTGLPKGLFNPNDPTKTMVSPMFVHGNPDQTEHNIETVVEVAKGFSYWFTLQWHKLIGIR